MRLCGRIPGIESGLSLPVRSGGILNLAEIHEKARLHGFESLTKGELLFAKREEMELGLASELPFHVAYRREQAISTPSYFITEVVDDFYKQNFEDAHYKLCDEVIGPYLLGETVVIDAQARDPRDYIGLLVLMSRDTFKSSIAGMMLFWKYIYFKLKLGIDLREMYCHEVIGKAIERGEVIRQHALHNARFRETFSEFHGAKGDWDRQEKWNWPSKAKTGPTEYSFIAYGETSKKTGGHYTGRWADDWESENSVTTQEQRNGSYDRFRMLDNLKDRTQTFSPFVISDTTYHFDGVMKRLIRDGGYLLYEVPAHKGSAKALFDLRSISDRDEAGRQKIKAGIRKLERERPDDLNFPKRLPWRECYMSAKAQGPRIYASQFLLNPTPEGDQRFPEADVEDMWIDWEDLPSPTESISFVRVDPAISKKKEADDTAIIVGLIDWKGHRYAVDGWAGREKRPTEQVRKTFAFARKWTEKGYKCFNIGIESVAYQEALAQLCRDGVPEREAEHHGELIPVVKSPCPIRSIKRSPDMQKTERILQMEGPISRREFKILRENPIGTRFATQLKNFPFDKDDILDAHRDLWSGIVLPSRSMDEPDKELHDEIAAILKRNKYKGREKLVGTNTTVKLTAW